MGRNCQPEVGCRSQMAFTLVELMISLAIASVLMLGAVTLFLHNKISYVQDEELARLQENGRYALRYLTREISMAGFYGGILRGSTIDIDNGVADPNDPGCYNYMFRAGEKITFINDVTSSTSFTDSGLPVGSDATDCIDHSEVQSGTDVLVLRRVKDTATVKQGVTAAGASIESGVVYLKIEDYNVSIQLTNGLTSAGSEVDLWEYQPQLLYIRDHALSAGDGIPTLCRVMISRASEAMAPEQCLVQGIEQFHVEFGLDTVGDYTVDTYSADPNEPTLSEALTARIYLLMRSPNEVSRYTNDKSFTLGQKSVAAANDSYYRRVMITAVSLRNSDALGI